ncbi:MAG TPA: hypothetical protein VLV46_13830 [Gaiellaceae bacterium]|nr:hypothetical protein [Gaiellaceae bacterium]
MIAVVHTVDGAFAVDLDGEEEVTTWAGPLIEPEEIVLNLPRLVAAAATGAVVLAVVEAKPPLLVSHDAASTWRATGHGLPPGRAVALSEENPDVALYATRNRLYLSRDGGRFWAALAVELPEIEAIELREG